MIKHLLEIFIALFENKMHVGKSLRITFCVLKQEEADSKRMPTAALQGLTHGLNFSVWVM